MTEASRRRKWPMRLAAGLLGVVLAFVLGEAAVRIAIRMDDGRRLFSAVLDPGRRNLRLEAVRRTLKEYRTTTRHRMEYDPETGWKPRPNAVSHNGMYRYNSFGIRSAPREYSVTPGSEAVRIALFGDSFTHGDDVPWEATWAVSLESRLVAAGVQAEVLNFGVSAYGMDQAYLRWRQLGRKFRPHIVLFGFQAENVLRNVNLIRAFYVPETGIPFSKPRFVLEADGRLKLINHPTLPLTQIPEVLADADDWPLIEHEWFYDGPRSSWRKPRWWECSRLAAVCAAYLRETTATAKRRNAFELDGEPARITLGLLRRFRREVEAEKGRFFVVHLPRRQDLQARLDGRRLVYAALWRAVRAEHTVIDPEPALEAAAARDSLESVIQRHYTPRGNQIIGDFVARWLLREGLAPSS